MATAFRVTGWQAILLLIVLAPLLLVAALFVLALMILFAVVLLPYGFVSWRLSERRLRQDMKRRGRFIDRKGLMKWLRAGTGTLIEDNWHNGPYRIWWTPDDINAKGQLPSTDEDYFAILRGEDHPFLRECWLEYLDREHGRALLTPLSRREVRSGRIASDFPHVPVVNLTWPGGVPTVQASAFSDEPLRQSLPPP